MAEVGAEGGKRIDDDHGEAKVFALEELQHLAEAAICTRVVARIKEGGRNLVAMSLAEVEEGAVLVADGALDAVAAGAMFPIEWEK